MKIFRPFKRILFTIYILFQLSLLLHVFLHVKIYCFIKLDNNCIRNWRPLWITKTPEPDGCNGEQQQYKKASWEASRT